MQIRVKEHLDVVEQNDIADLLGKDVVQHAGHPQRALTGGQVEQSLGQGQVEVDDWPAMLGREIAQRGSLAGTMMSDDEDQPVVELRCLLDLPFDVIQMRT